MNYQTPPCTMCGKTSMMRIDRQSFYQWKGGSYVQNAFPDMTVDDRELLVSGTHPDCWDTLFEDDQ